MLPVGDMKCIFMQVEILENVPFIGETLPKFRQKVSVFNKWAWHRGMSGIPKDSSRILGKFGAGPFSWYQSSRFNFLWTLHIMCILKLWGSKWVPSRNDTIATLRTSQKSKFFFTEERHIDRQSLRRAGALPQTVVVSEVPEGHRGRPG